MLSLHEAAAMLENAPIFGDAGVRFSGVSTDSRNVAAGELFVALKGERFDGHDYLEQVAARGAVAALVMYETVGSTPLPTIRVADTRVALGTLARQWRRRFQIPLIAVTGSNGKTTTKEMIAAILVAAYGSNACLATRGNLNNDIGVPLTLLRLRAAHRCAVIELGMNHPGETALLAALAAPTVTLITNAQREHQEFMQSVEAVAREHALAINALPANGTAVFPAEDVYASWWWKAAGDRGVIEFGLKRAVSPGQASFSPFQAAVTASVVGGNTQTFASSVEIQTPAGQVTVNLQAAGEHNVRNAAAAAAAALAAGVPLAAIATGLEAFVPVRGRMQKKHGPHGSLLIDDSYNANPDSVLAAIDVLVGTPGPHTLILGDMGEVGDAGPAFHAEVGRYAATHKVERLLCLGVLTRHTCAAFGSTAQHFDDIDALIENARAHSGAGTVLVKGSRFMGMERIVDALDATLVQGST